MVPEGSILGPLLLFWVYINEIANLNLKCELIMYADDMIYCSHANWWEA